MSTEPYSRSFRYFPTREPLKGPKFLLSLVTWPLEDLTAPQMQRKSLFPRPCKPSGPILRKIQSIPQPPTGRHTHPKTERSLSLHFTATSLWRMLSLSRTVPVWIEPASFWIAYSCFDGEHRDRLCSHQHVFMRLYSYLMDRDSAIIAESSKPTMPKRLAGISGMDSFSSRLYKLTRKSRGQSLKNKAKKAKHVSGVEPPNWRPLIRQVPSFKAVTSFIITSSKETAHWNVSLQDAGKAKHLLHESKAHLNNSTSGIKSLPGRKSHATLVSTIP